MGKSKTTEANKNTHSEEEIPQALQIKEWRWIGTGVLPSFPAAPITTQWLAQMGISHETIAATGLYNPVYEEDTVNGNTRTKTATENPSGERNTSTGDASSILLENESSGGDVE